MFISKFKFHYIDLDYKDIINCIINILIDHQQIRSSHYQSEFQLFANEASLKRFLQLSRNEETNRGQMMENQAMKNKRLVNKKVAKGLSSRAFRF